MWDGNHEVARINNKLSEKMVPDRLMLTILDSIAANQSAIEITDWNARKNDSVRLAKLVDPSSTPYTFIEAFDSRKCINLYSYDPGESYYQSIWNTGVKSTGENCTHLNVAIEIAYRWWAYCLPGIKLD